MNAGQNKGYGFGTFAGVFTPSILTIIGVIMYLRFGWILGNAGLPKTLLMVAMGSSITLSTALAISAIATNRRVEAGGAYHMLSRSFGAEAGAATGYPLFASQAVSVTFYAAGFAEALRPVLLDTFGYAPSSSHIAALTILFLWGLTAASANLATRAQYVIMACIVLSLVSFFTGRPPEPESLVQVAEGTQRAPFWTVFAVFFPAVTGILSGVGMSGDLRDPRRAIPRGTVAAVLVGWAIYTAVPVAMRLFVPDDRALMGDMTVFFACARIRSLVLLGVWAATLSSAIGCLLCAPRTLQALARDRLAPQLFSRGFGRNGDPLAASAFTFALATGACFVGPIDLLAPILTMINLATYGMLNLSACLEGAMGAPSWRPTLRIPSVVFLFGAAGCLAAMLLIDPGRAIFAAAIVAFIYWAATRKALRARWGDMRDGLAASLVRLAMRRLSRQQEPGKPRNWRPGLLVFAGDPSRHEELLALTGALCRNRSLATVATTVPNSLWTPSRVAETESALSAALTARGLDACVRVQPGSSTWASRLEMVRTYGFGPLVPNTVLLEEPSAREEFLGLADLAAEIAARKRNLLVLHTRADGIANLENLIDVWWRGRYQNGAFMLALAWLAANSPVWRGAQIRLCSICSDGSDPSKVRVSMEEFLREARLDGQVLVLEAEKGSSTFSMVREASRESSLVLLGLPFVRPLAEGDDAPTRDAWADAAFAQTSALASLPRVLFAMAAEGVDFKGIFEE